VLKKGAPEQERVFPGENRHNQKKTGPAGTPIYLGPTMGLHLMRTADPHTRGVETNHTTTPLGADETHPQGGDHNGGGHSLGAPTGRETHTRKEGRHHTGGGETKSDGHV